MLAMSTSPPTWSDNILEGIATKKVPENRRSNKEVHYLRTFPCPRCLQFWDSQTQKGHLVSDAPREWPEWGWLMYKSILLRLGEGSACWGLLKLVMKII